MNPNHTQPCLVNSYRHGKSKPFVSYRETLTDEASKLLRKRFSKFIHKISMPEEQMFVPNLSHVKLLHTFECSRFESVTCSYRYILSGHASTKITPLPRRHAPVTQLLKVLKPMKNQIKTLTVGSSNSFIRYFPHIKIFNLDMRKAAQWRPFLLCCRIESLNMSLIPENWELSVTKDIISSTQCIKKYGLRFVQRMIDRKSIKHLRVCLTARLAKSCQKIFRDLANCCLVLLTKMTPLLTSSSLKSFTYLDQNSFLLGPQYRTKHPKDVLQYATQLNIPGYFWSSRELYSYISPDSLKSLVDLKLSFSGNDSDLSGLSSLSTLPCVKKINFSFKRCEEAFIKYFTLPKTVISAHLKLKDFHFKRSPYYFTKKETYETAMTYIREDPRCIEFSNRWSSFDHLKHLKVRTYDYIENIDIFAHFVMLMIEHVPSLETFIYEQYRKMTYRYRKYSDNESDEELEPPEIFDKSSVSIDRFLKKLQKSKSSLQKLLIKAQNLSYHNPQNILTEMPQLRSFTLYSYDLLRGGQNLIIKICKDSLITQPQAVPCLLNIHQPLIEDNLGLIDFLGALHQIPEAFDHLTISVYITRVNPVILVKHLWKFLTKTNMQGSLCLMIEKYCLCSWENVEKIKTAALKNSSLRLFQIKSEIEDKPQIYRRYQRKKEIYILETRRGILTKSWDRSIKLA